jgi:hypothetical protein
MTRNPSVTAKPKFGRSSRYGNTCYGNCYDSQLMPVPQPEHVFRPTCYGGGLSPPLQAGTEHPFLYRARCYDQLTCAACGLIVRVPANARFPRRACQVTPPRAPDALPRSAATQGGLAQTLTSDSRKPAGEPSLDRYPVDIPAARLPASHALPNSRSWAPAGDRNRCVIATMAALGRCSTDRWSARRPLCARMLRDSPRKLEDPREEWPARRGDGQRSYWQKPSPNPGWGAGWGKSRRSPELVPIANLSRFFSPESDQTNTRDQPPFFSAAPFLKI